MPDEKNADTAPLTPAMRAWLDDLDTSGTDKPVHRYERCKARFAAAFPEATPSQYARAMTLIAGRVGG